MSLRCALSLLILGSLFAALPGLAHTRSTSYSTWEIDGREARVRLRIPQLELTRLPWGIVNAPHFAPELGSYLVEALQLEVGGLACPVVEGPIALQGPAERALFEWRLRCPSDGAQVIRSGLLSEVAPSHMHFARLRGPDGGSTERVLNTGAPRWTLQQASEGEVASPVGSSIAEYVALGVAHIATGVDHLVFLLGLLLLAGWLREVVTIVTGFTVAHSITLALAAVGRVQPEAAAVEALIGLSIALVAAENGWLLSGRGSKLPIVVVSILAGLAGLAAFGVGAVPGATFAGLALFSACYFALLQRVDRPMRLRAAIAFCFGLIHGFGFAGVLTEIALPQGRLLPALLGFNLGVELGQLAIVALAWPLLRALTRWQGGRYGRPVMELGTAVVCALGVFWLVGRGYG